MSGGESEKVVAVSSRGQVTIPEEFREKLNLEAPDLVKFVLTEGGEIVLKPTESLKDLRGIGAGQTDGHGRSGTELLREERNRDRDMS